MKVFKFGGASVKDAVAIKNAVRIVSSYTEPLVIVISAIGKTTNALETLWTAYVNRDAKGLHDSIAYLSTFHRSIIADLKDSTEDGVHPFAESFAKLQAYLTKEPSDNIAYEYDQIVSYGELWSTMIVEQQMKDSGINSQWLDASKIIRTSDHYQEGRIEWEKTKELVDHHIASLFEQENALQCVITQGFIGHTNTGMTTTLGREGSDFSAAILAWALEVDEVLIWKDVPGLLNADPKVFDNTIKIDRISYREAIELSYFGASIIHPKTLKPLQNKNIPLKIKSFVHPQAEGTIIHFDESQDYNQPSYIYKTNQLLITISPKDFSFIMEDHISVIFNVFSKHGVKVHLMQNSALNFSVCANVKTTMCAALIKELSANFLVRYNEDVDLFTIRHYENHIFQEKLKQKTVLIQQRSRSTLRYVLR